jgi:hypothetical protein
MEITVSIKTVYGVDQIYPACKQSMLFAEIAGTKTLTHATLCRIERLGYKINVTHAKEFVTQLMLNRA